MLWAKGNGCRFCQLAINFGKTSFHNRLPGYCRTTRQTFFFAAAAWTLFSHPALLDIDKEKNVKYFARKDIKIIPPLFPQKFRGRGLWNCSKDCLQPCSINRRFQSPCLRLPNMLFLYPDQLAHQIERLFMTSSNVLIWIFSAFRSPGSYILTLIS